MASNHGEAHSVDLERGDLHVKETHEKETQSTARAVGVARNYSSQIPADRIWTPYNAKSEKHDRLLASRLKGSMDSILVFAGLFSAIVTAFIIESYKLLSADSGNTTVFYLAQISQQLTSQSTSPFPSIAPPPFESSRTSVVVNILWVLSLISSLACALGATLMQSWTSRYIELINASPDVATRARYRAWYLHGLKKFQMENFAAAVPALLHIAMFLFLAGLVVFLFPINHEVAYAAMSASIALAAVYLMLAVTQLLVKNSPYHTPLSKFLWACVVLVSRLVIYVVVVSGSLIAIALIAVSVLILFPFAMTAYILPGPPKRWLNKVTRFEFRMRKKLLSGQLGRAPDLSPLHSRLRGSPTEKQEEDGKVLRWLLQHSTTVPEMEEFIKGLEPFVERDPDHIRSAQLVLELGGIYVECLSAEFGLGVGHLLESCAQPTDLPLEHRRSRAISCTRAMISTMSYTSTKERTANFGSGKYVPATVKNMRGTRDPIRWAYWGSEVVLTAINSMQKDKDPVLAFHAFCLSSILIHRSLSDIASRMKSGEVLVSTPTEWDLRTILRVSRDIRRHRLHELFVATSLDPTIGDKPSGTISTSFAIPLGQWDRATRPIALEFTLQEGDETPYASVSVSHSKIQNEATLFALYILLDYVRTSVVPPSLAHSDLLKRTALALVQNGSASETSGSMQHSFIDLLASIYALRKADTDASETRITFHSDAESSHTPPTAWSLLLSDDVMNLLVPIIASLDDPECTSEAMALLQDIRPGYVRTLAELTPSVHDDDRDISEIQKEKSAVDDSGIQRWVVGGDSKET